MTFIYISQKRAMRKEERKEEVKTKMKRKETPIFRYDELIREEEEEE
jgi:hypothetical protein